MAAAYDNHAPVLAAKPPPATPPGHLDTATLRVLALGLGMNPDAENELLKPDINYIRELVKVPIDLTNMPRATDVEGMRKWIAESYLSEPFIAYREILDIKRRRPKQEISKEIISVAATDGNGGFGLWIYQPPARTGEIPSARPAILMFHGGGWIHGSPLGDEGKRFQNQKKQNLAELFASELDAIVIGVDYRLAPEHKFPAPLEDCSDALDWVIQKSSAYNIDIGKLGIWGASAGGNLAAALTLRYSEAQATSHHPDLCLVSLVVPAAAHPAAQASFDKNRTIPLSQSESRFFNESSLPPAVVEEFAKLLELYSGSADPLDPLVSPLLGHPTTRHPPTCVTVAACDPLRAQGLALAQLLRSSGVSVTEDLLPGVPHMFNLPTSAEVTKSWIVRQVNGFAEAFGLDALEGTCKRQATPSALRQ